MTAPTSSFPKKQPEAPEETSETDTAEALNLSGDVSEASSETPADISEEALAASPEPGPEPGSGTDPDISAETAVSSEPAKDDGDNDTVEIKEPEPVVTAAVVGAAAAKVVQVQPGARRAGGPGRSGIKAGGPGRPGLKAAGAGGAGLRRQSPPDTPIRDAHLPKSLEQGEPDTGQSPSAGAAGRKSAKGGAQGRPTDSPSRDRSPEDVNERAARRAAARAEQADQGDADPTTLPVPSPQGQPPAKKGKGKKDKPKIVVVQPPVGSAGLRTRHWVTLLSFLLMVALPVAVAGWYLWNRAADQYASYVGFSVRTEEVGSSIEIMGLATDLSGSSTSDTDILYEFLQGQELVGAIDADLDLRNIWSKADPDVDPIFAYHPPGTIEDLTAYWARMVKIYYDPGTGLIDLRVLAFDPINATAIATQIRDRSSAMINKLSAIAREDAIGYAREELTQAEDRLKEARVALQAFRNRTQLVDPTMQTQTQSGLIGALEGQLADAQIERRLLQETARANDPRIRQTELKIEVIKAQIAEERAELGLEGVDDNVSVADLVGEFEALAVDREFAEQAYTAALATFVSAQNEARRQSRYLAAHVNPTKAEKSQYPDRIQIMVLLSLLLILIWAVSVLTGYALRDRR
ncbi:capsule biosynthesis protein [Falsiphaeobacter marinintestinus]|uniref:capsule biosynthesis protein n=1 Tax=Falsiphaeobacter marinintestinus TaxID=1492905 RepID=UPI001FE8FF11|nr:capsule biosynthesis protein [Phaeobacter marinintestinus]